MMNGPDRERDGVNEVPLSTLTTSTRLRYMTLGMTMGQRPRTGIPTAVGGWQRLPRHLRRSLSVS